MEWLHEEIGGINNCDKLGESKVDENSNEYIIFIPYTRAPCKCQSQRDNDLHRALS